MSRTTRQRRTRKGPVRRVSPSHFAPPPPQDREKEYRDIRRDLIGILIWGGGLIAIMILLKVTNVFG